jgi:hypothetical protein
MKPVNLIVRLTSAAQGDSRNTLELQVDQRERKTDLLVLVYGEAFTVSPQYQVLTVSLDSPKAEVEFTLRAKELGMQTIEIVFLRNCERVAYCSLSSEVVKKESLEGRADLGTFEFPTNRDLMRRDEVRLALLVEWAKEGTLRYRVLDPVLDPLRARELGDSPSPIPRSQVLAWVQKQNSIIRDYLKEDCSDEAELQGVLANLRAIGYGLFRQLMPAAFTEVVRSIDTGSIVAIESNEGWVPWELLSESPTAPLWGERFQLVRVPRVPQDTLIDPSAIVQTPSSSSARIEIGRILSVVGDGIERGSEPGSYSSQSTFGTARPYVSELIEGTSVELAKLTADVDIVHFTCHGKSEPTYYLSLGPGAGRRFVVDQVHQLHLKPGAVIFANACSSDKSELLLTEFESLGWNFYLRGARPFIGTLGPVPVKHAIILAGHFYNCFIGNGLPAGQALRQARLLIAEQIKSPFSLFYCLYGSASTRRMLPS